MYICVCTWAYKYTFSLVPLGLCSVYIYGHALTVYGHAHAIYRHGTAHVLTCGVVAVLLPSAPPARPPFPCLYHTPSSSSSKQLLCCYHFKQK